MRLLRLRRRTRRSRIMTLLTLTTVLCVFLTPLYWIYKPPKWLITHLASRHKDVIWQHPGGITKRKIVALTIDDAPSAYTSEILSILDTYREKNVHATFFVIGNQVSTPEREESLVQIVARGHELGNHAFRDEVSNSLPEEQLVEQIRLVEGMVGKAYRTVNDARRRRGPVKGQSQGQGWVRDQEQAETGPVSMTGSGTAGSTRQRDRAGQRQLRQRQTHDDDDDDDDESDHDHGIRQVDSPILERGKETLPNQATDLMMPKLFRPGAGWFSAKMRKTLSRLGYKLVLGSIYPHDAQISYWEVNARHILSMLRPGGIIICHDRRSWTVPMLKVVVPEILARGYEIVTVSELLQVPPD